MKILIVDDEALARQRLQRLLARLQPDAELAEAANGEEALQQCESFEPAIVLLDIRMPGIDGVAVADRLSEQDAPPAVIFCTAYDEYALAALDKQAIAYLLKPVRERELERALAAATRVNRAQLQALGVSPVTDDVVASGHRGTQRLPLAEVRCFLADEKYVRACAPDGELLLSDTLKDLEERYEGRFLRVHRNALVALSHVQGLLRGEQGWVLQLDGVTVQPQVSRRHVSELRERLKSG